MNFFLFGAGGATRRNKVETSKTHTCTPQKNKHQQKTKKKQKKDFWDNYQGPSPDLNKDGNKPIWVWDRAADAYTHVQNPEQVQKSCGSFVQLADGDILLAAAYDKRETMHALSTTTYALTRRADLTVGRWYASAVLLPDGT